MKLSRLYETTRLHETTQNKYFQGTTYKIALKIIKNGFDPKATKHTTHGQDANFFSPDPVYAMSYMSGDEFDYGILFEVDLDGFELFPDHDIYAKGSVYVKDLIPTNRIIGIYKFSHPHGEQGVYDIDNNYNTKCIEVIKGSLFKVGDEIKVPMGHRGWS
jgi:hypothetical protein